MSDDIAKELRRRGQVLPEQLVDPHPSRLGDAPEATIATHRRAIADGLDGYADPATGLFCFTATYHWDKGSCCESGCRHCPWIEADTRLRQRHMHHPGDGH